MKKFLKKYWHDLCFMSSIILALFMRTYWTSILVFLVALFIVFPVEIKKINKEKSEKFIKQKSKTIKIV